MTCARSSSRTTTSHWPGTPDLGGGRPPLDASLFRGCPHAAGCFKPIKPIELESTGDADIQGRFSLSGVVRSPPAGLIVSAGGALNVDATILRRGRAEKPDAFALSLKGCSVSVGRPTSIRSDVKDQPIEITSGGVVETASGSCTGLSNFYWSSTTVADNPGIARQSRCDRGHDPHGFDAKQSPAV
jgi:hypothetical protein